MSYIALYRKWRPLVFEDVVEQEHVVKTLKHAVSTDRIAHAYLFCGTRGTGKTTMAHIMSRAINCPNSVDGDPCNKCEICTGIMSGTILDVLEMDAASNNSVDNIRDIRDEVVYAPSRARFKVYIIDEVHMLSTGAFNALLKTLEEPPSHVVFILATTEPHKLPATILSRCQRFDFRRITVDSIIGRLDKIAQANSVIIERDSLRLIAKLADGAMRDAISLLDQCISLGSNEISYENVLTVVGIVKDTFIADVVEAINQRQISTLLEMVEKLIMDGKDITQFSSDLITHYRNLLICKVTGKPEDIIEGSRETLALMQKQCTLFDEDTIVAIIRELSSLEASLKWSAHPRILLEVALIRICQREFIITSDNLATRLETLERKIANGEFVQTSTVHGKPTSTTDTCTNRSGNSAEILKQQSTPKVVFKPGKEFVEWPSIIAEIKSQSRMALYAYLLNTKAYISSENLLIIVFASTNRLNMVQVSKPENTELLESAALKVTGNQVRVKCMGDDGQTPVSSAPIEKKNSIEEKLKAHANIADVPFDLFDE